MSHVSPSIFSKYVGKKTNDVIDTLNADAAHHGLRVALMGDPNGPFHNIDVDPQRLCVWERDGVILKMAIG